MIFLCFDSDHLLGERATRPIRLPSGALAAQARRTRVPEADSAAAMRSSSAQTSAMRPDKRKRPAVPGACPASTSRKIRSGCDGGGM